MKAVKLCEAKCLEWSPCLSFDIDVVKEVCYLSATRSQPTHVNGNAALFVRVTDWLALKQVCGGFFFWSGVVEFLLPVVYNVTLSGFQAGVRACVCIFLVGQ